jgi:hypothetical protein
MSVHTYRVPKLLSQNYAKYNFPSAEKHFHEWVIFIVGLGSQHFSTFIINKSEFVLLFTALPLTVCNPHMPLPMSSEFGFEIIEFF